MAELERRLKIRLPQEYRSFLLEFNGGYFEDADIVPVEEGCPQDGLDYLCGIASGDGQMLSELGNAIDVDLFDNNDPMVSLPIGGTGMGGLIVLSLWPEEAGTILYKKPLGDFYLLADGIEEFFELLTDPGPYE